MIYSMAKRQFFPLLGVAVAALLPLIAGCSHQDSSPAGLDKSAQASVCANQLKILANAKKLWAEQNRKSADDTPAMSDVTPFIRGSTACPGGGTYTIGKVGEPPTCSIAEHQAAFTQLMQSEAGQAH